MYILLQLWLQVGGKRCDDLTDYTCVLSQLGSGHSTSNSGSGFLTTEDYRNILRYAKERHITVTPEFDMPGHAYAAVVSMKARYHKYKDTNLTKAEEFLLSDFNNTSQYYSAQDFTDDVINPCLESTYVFLDHLVQQVGLIKISIKYKNRPKYKYTIFYVDNYFSLS